MYKFRQGFFCDDRSIQHETKPDTVSNVVLGLSTLVPFLIIWIVEKLTFDETKYCDSSPLKNCIKWWKEYATGLAMQFIIFSAVKNFTGELRPDFINTCKPDKFENCTDRYRLIVKSIFFKFFFQK